MAQCPHGNSMPDQLIARLEDSQAGSGRHRCAICAYGLGVIYTGSQAEMESCSHGNLGPAEILSGLPEYQGGLSRHKCVICAFIEGVAHGAANPDRDTVEIVDEGGQEGPGRIEGAPVWRTHRIYERDPRNRARAIVYHGNRCLGCGFSFDDVYTPEHARGYVEVHHIHPLSEGPRVVDPYEDLIPLCANCHRMVHRRGDDWLSLEELRQLVEEARNESEN